MSVLVALALAVTGLHGTVTRGPTKPVCSMSEPCSEPAVGAVLLFERRGHVVRVRVGAHGRYSVRLAPGVYAVLLPTKPRIGFALRPMKVSVVRGRSRRVDFSIDTGIR
jgi:hypothetical protein